MKLPLSIFSQCLLTVISFLLVAFGQPAWFSWSGLLAAAGGYALFWRVLLAYPSRWCRFILASLWFLAVQLVQLSWFASHPYLYIYSVYFLLSLAIGFQFGLIAIFITPDLFRRFKPINFLAIAALWTVQEWARLFVVCGFSWNPVGLAFTGNLYALQMASLGGVLGLSFWLIVVNLFALNAWVQPQKKIMWIGIWLALAMTPYIYGAVHVAVHKQGMARQQDSMKAVLVQTAFPVEETKEFSDREGIVRHVIEEWRQVLKVTKKHRGQPVQLVVLPEFVVPFGTYSFIYPLKDVMASFLEIFSPDRLDFLPTLDFPLAAFQQTEKGPQFLVNNAYWVQALANYFKADMLVGLEDAEDVSPGIREYYSAAIFVHPQKDKIANDFFAERYSKRVLLPMGEYIPFSFFASLAQRYGVFGSFTPGKEAAVMTSGGVLFSPSICYEETFGDVIREGRKKGAQVLVNLTSDAWYPNSKLPRQHLDHARLRTVENGVPLLRACNTGVTAALDSLGRTHAVLGGDYPEEVEWVSDSLFVDIPLYTYGTLYSRFGDRLIIGFCLVICLFYFIDRKS